MTSILPRSLESAFTLAGLPADSNPYAVFSVVMYNTMYPPLAKGYRARTIALYTMLSYMIVSSLVYILVMIRRSRREQKDIWVWRFVKQQQGTYFHLNQHILFPLGSLLLGIWWIIYTRRMQQMWGGENNRTIYYYLSFVAVPAFAQAWVVTFAVISGANLASARPGTQGIRHLLPSKVANSILILLPGLLLALFVTCIRTGGSYAHLRDIWDGQYDGVLESAAVYDGKGNVTEILGQLAQQTTIALGDPYVDFRAHQRISMIVTIICFCILLLINVSGGISLVGSLRQSDGHLTSASAPIVAPLAEYGAGEDGLKEATPVAVPSEWYEDPEAYRAGVQEEKKQEKGERLDWDVTLYYFLVPVVAGAYLAYAIWVFTRFFNQTAPRAIEVSGLIIVWGYGGVTVLSMTSVMIKIFFFEKKKIITFVQDTPTHVVNKLKLSGRRRGSWTDSVVGPLEGIREDDEKVD